MQPRQNEEKRSDSDRSGLRLTERVKHERRRGLRRHGDADLDDNLLFEGGARVVSGETQRLQADGRGGLYPKKKRRTAEKKKKGTIGSLCGRLVWTEQKREEKEIGRRLRKGRKKRKEKKKKNEGGGMCAACHNRSVSTSRRTIVRHLF